MDLRFSRPIIIYGCALAFYFVSKLAAAQPVDVPAMRARVDQLLAERWKVEGMTPAPITSDAEFLRRVHLDLIGRVPKVADVRAFLADTRPDKRLRYIDKLLDNPSHILHAADRWQQILLANNVDAQIRQFPSLLNWLVDQFTANTPYNEMVRELITTEGSIQGPGPQLFFAAAGNRPEEMASTTARAFLGVRLECAQCHDHPFDDWKQADYWGYAAFFARVGPQQPRWSANVTTMPTGEVHLPNQSDPVRPKFLQGDEIDPKYEAQRRRLLAEWITARDNPYFAKATVNRVWAQFFGRGLVEPVDDMRASNLASHPQLLDELADFFVASNFDLWQLHRVLAGTQAYQLSSAVASGNARPELFSAMALKPLTAEQLYDSIRSIGLVADSEANNRRQDRFFVTFGSPVTTAGEYTAGIPQALTLMNGDTVRQIVQESPLLRALSLPALTDRDRVEVMFLASLSRFPGDEELVQCLQMLSDAQQPDDRQRAYSNILWSLVNSAEFAFNH